MFISIIIPCKNEDKNIPVLTKEIVDTMQNVNHDYEILFVNDGSTDNSWQVIGFQNQLFPQVQGLDMVGNHGQTAALRAGFEFARGDVIVAMDSDLQHDPKYIPEFIKYIEDGYEMVGGYKAERPEKWLMRKMSSIAHWLIYKISKVRMNYFGATFKAYRKYLLKDLNLIGDNHRYIGAFIAQKGVKFIEIPIVIRERFAGKSSYNLSKSLNVIFDLIFLKFLISHMKKPFRFFAKIGFAFILIGILPVMYFYIASVFGNFNVHADYLSEYLFFLVIILIGLILLAFGFVAEIGVYNYYAEGKIRAYKIRRTILSKPNIYETVDN